MNREEEYIILKQIQKDPKQFGVLFDKYYNPIFNYILRRVADYDTSRDIASVTFLKAYLHIQSFVWKNIPISTWLYRIAINEINFHFRKRKNFTIPLDPLLNHNDFDVIDTEDYLNEKDLHDKELQAHGEYLKVQRCLTKLDLKYQEVLSLRYFEKKSLKEISEILDKKEGTIKSLLSRGTEKLKSLF